MPKTLLLTSLLLITGVAHADAEVIELDRLANEVAGQEIRIESIATLTRVTNADEISYLVSEPADAVADQICQSANRRRRNLGHGNVELCTARDL